MSGRRVAGAGASGTGASGTGASGTRRAGGLDVSQDSVLAAHVPPGLPGVGVLPRARSRHAFTLLGRLAAPGPAPLVTPGVIMMIGIGLATQLPRPGTWRQVRDRFVLLPPVVQGVTLGILLVVITAIADQQGVAPFIYFRF